MKIGVVGANSSVGTELCFHLKQFGVDVIPIVRSKIGSSTFNHFGFDYKLIDVADDSEENRSSLSELDAVAIAAFAPFKIGKSKSARETNKKLVKNSVRGMPKNTSIIYFSSLMAFGSDIGRSNWHWYCRENRRLENILMNETKGTTKKGYAFRLGHVFGQYQERTELFREKLKGSGKLYVPCKPGKPSNILHLVTLADAITHCTQADVNPGTYSIVNQPQWSWKKTLEFYKDEEMSLEFVLDKHTQSSVFTLGTVMFMILKSIPIDQSKLKNLSPFLPSNLMNYIEFKQTDQNMKTKLNDFRRRERWDRREFQYGPVPGPFLHGLRDTQELLTNLKTDELLTPEYINE